MNEEMRVEANNNQEIDTTPDYISAINEIKANTVSRETYDKIKAENKRLLDALVSGKEIDIKKEEPVNIQELRNHLFDDSQKTNLDYVDTALKLRNALIEKGEKDPFLPFGDKVQVNDQHYQDAEEVAAVLQHCVDFAQGDSGVFTARLQALTKDTNLPRRR